MQAFDAQDWVRKIREHNNPLVVAGEGCRRIRLDGKPLAAYAIDLAEALACPLAATGNVVLNVREQASTVKTKKMWLAELFRYLEEDWGDALLEERPDLLLLIGYRPEMVAGLVAGLREVSVAHLGPGELATAQLTMEQVSLAEWKRRLDELISAFK